MGEVPLHLPRRAYLERDFFIGNLLVWVYFITKMIKRTGLASWDFESHFSGGLVSTFLRAYLPPGAGLSLASPHKLLLLLYYSRA